MKKQTKYNLVTYIDIKMWRNQILTRVLLHNIDPVKFLKSMGDACYPLAISELTKDQFYNMKESFPTIQVIDN